MKQFLIITLVLIFMVMLLRKPDRIIMLLKAINQTFAKIWLGLVKQ